MNIAEICIKRPVLATVINLMIVLIGVVAFDRLSVREYPNIDPPVVKVTTRYLGASANIIETQVTKPLEDSLSGIDGIDFIRSISRSEESQVTVQFRLSRDQDSAAADVRDRVARVREILPEEVDEPIIAKEEADASPFIWMSLSSDKHSMLELSEIADVRVQDALQIVPGVSTVVLFAERRYAMRVSLDREKLASRKLTTADIERALLTQNVEIPAGRIESLEREFTVVAQTDLNTPEEFRQVIVGRGDNESLIRLGEVADVNYGALEDRQIARFNNKPAVALGVVRQSVANPLEISQNIRAKLPGINKNLPEGMKLQIAFDASVFIDRSISNVFTTILEAIALVVVVIFLFLRNVRATLIPLVTIPVSLIGVLAMMYFLGYSINVLTMLALVIAIGLVVDDAIVVLENIYRHMEEGLSAMQAAIKGMREVSFAVVAMTITLVTVFLPVALTPGRTGQLFVEFAITLAGAVFISGITALTLSPMMCARMLRYRSEAEQPKWSVRIEQFLRRMENGYHSMLTHLVHKKLLMAIAAFAIMLIGIGLFTQLRNELSPNEDRGVVFAVAIAPEGSTIEYSDSYVKQMEAILQSTSEGTWNFVAIGFPTVTETFSVLGLKHWSERSRSNGEIVGSLFPPLMGITGTMNFAFPPASLGQGARSQAVEFIIQTTGTYAELDNIVNQVMAKVMQNPNIMNPDTDLKLNKPEIQVRMSREKLASLGIDVAEVGRTMETMLGGREVTRFKRGSEQYDVLVKIADDKRRTPTDMTQLFVRSASSDMVPLSNLITLEETVAPKELNHFNKLRAVTIKANLAPGYGLGEALGYLENAVEEVAPDALVDYAGISREYKESAAGMGMIFALAMAFIFLVLAAQFESFRDPLVILLSVPLAASGAVAAMVLTGGSLNIYSQIGLIALMGLISKHGIMMVEFANQLRVRGLSKAEAMVKSASVRMRPILMTTAATVFGALPLALASGAGAEARQAIGWVIVGGMSFGTLFTLFILPSFYMLIASDSAREDIANAA